MEEISAWEAGAGGPSYAQLEKLAYELYKRPLAIFLLPSPPPEPRPSSCSASEFSSDVRLRTLLPPPGSVEMLCALLRGSRAASEKAYVNGYGTKLRNRVWETTEIVGATVNLTLMAQRRRQRAGNRARGMDAAKPLLHNRKGARVRNSGTDLYRREYAQQG